MSAGTFAFNGFDDATGGYVLPDLTVQDVSKMGLGESLDATRTYDLELRRKKTSRSGRRARPQSPSASRLGRS